MIKPHCEITMLPAKEGDCIFLEFSYEKNDFTMLIDTGPISCWKTSLRPLLDRIIAQGKRINVLMLTHIDGDHIGGATRLLQTQNYSACIDEVWFNGEFQILSPDNNDPNIRDYQAYERINSAHLHIPDDCSDLISVKQGITVSEALRVEGISVNSFNRGNAITCQTPSYIINSHFYIDFLLPKPEQLCKIKNLFESELEGAVRGANSSNVPECAEAFEKFLLDQMPHDYITEDISTSSLEANAESVGKLCQRPISDDSSITNASSIAICIHFYGKNMLFPGDANSLDLTKSLEQWIENRGGTSQFDVIKLPHHGSVANCYGLIDQLDSEIYIISTDGKKFGHPSKETIARLISTEHNHIIKFVFNYQNDAFCFYDNQTLKEKFGYEIVFQKESLVIVGDMNEPGR